MLTEGEGPAEVGSPRPSGPHFYQQNGNTAPYIPRSCEKQTRRLQTTDLGLTRGHCSSRGTRRPAAEGAWDMGPGACSQRSPGRLLGSGPGSGPKELVQHPPRSPFTGGQTWPTEQESHAHTGREQSWECDSKGRALCHLPCHLLAWEGVGERGRPGPSAPAPVFRRGIALSPSLHSKHATGTPDTSRALNYLPQRKHVCREIPTGEPPAEPKRREAAFPPGGRSSLSRTPPPKHIRADPSGPAVRSSPNPPSTSEAATGPVASKPQPLQL